MTTDTQTLSGSGPVTAVAEISETLHQQQLAAVTAVAKPVLPSHMLADSKGRWVPKSMIKPLDLQADTLVKELAKTARSTQQILATFKRRALADVRAHLALAAEEYNTTLGGEKGNVTLRTYDGSLTVQIAVADRIGFNERLQIAKKLVDNCIDEWLKEGSRPEIHVIVKDAFSVDKKRTVNTEAVLRLRKLNIEHPVWKQAMKAIDDSIVTESTCTYIRFHERDADGKYRAIELDLSKV